MFVIKLSPGAVYAFILTKWQCFKYKCVDNQLIYNYSSEIMKVVELLYLLIRPMLIQ